MCLLSLLCYYRLISYFIPAPKSMQRQRVWLSKDIWSPAYTAFMLQGQQNAAVMIQPIPVVVQGTFTQPQRQPELGIGALAFAIASTIFMFFLGCWWSFPCTIVGIVLGVSVSYSWCMLAVRTESCKWYQQSDSALQG